MMDVAHLEAVLSRVLEPLRLVSIRRSFPGHSRETWLVQTEPLGGLVVRIDHRGGPLVPIPLRVEYEVYRRLWGTAVPVAEPLAYGEGDDLAEGRAWMVRRLVDGSPRPDGLTGAPTDAPSLRRSVCHALAEQLAVVHTLDWRGLGLDEVVFAPSSDESALHDEVRHWRALWVETRTDPFPMLTEATWWLEEQIPPGPHRRSFLKGNNGIGEEIWRDGRIVALSDWELASIGDPSLDWAFSQGLLSLHDTADTLAHYAERAGFAIEADHLAWATVWIRVKASMTTNGGLRGFLDGRDNRMARPALGLGIVTQTERWIASVLDRPVAEVGHQLLAGYRSPYLEGARS